MRLRSIQSCLFTILPLLFTSFTSYAVVRPARIIDRGNREQTSQKDLFPTDLFLRKQIAFWQLVFQKYPSSVILIHDLDEPNILVDIVDQTLLSELKPMNRTDFNKLSVAYVKRYQIAVQRFKEEREKALRYGAIENRIYQVYSRDPRALAKLYRGAVTMRAQQGLADTFLSAAQTAQQYLPFMEETFARQGLPKILTRLPFVESMFNINARSKVGASGMWQFMPSTARLYMNLNQFIDERNSPFKSTKGAALFMADNYRELGSWPLAITSYNHGRAGLERAVKLYRTKDLSTIIQRYESPTFGFASKNFYAEFIAAVNTYAHLQRSGKIPNTAPLKLEEVVMPNRTSLSKIVRASKLTPTQIAELNPCLMESAFSQHFDSPLPESFSLWLPKSAATTLRKNIAMLNNRQIYSKR